MTGHLALIEGTSLLHRGYHITAKGNFRSGVGGRPVGAINHFCETIWNLIGRFGSNITHVAVVGDAGGATFRHRKYAMYKANRPPKPDDLHAQLEMMDEAVKAFGMPYLACKGVEADDIIATLATRWVAAGLDRRCTIVSIDKDFAQLVTDRIWIYDPKNAEWIRPQQVVEKFGVKPSQMIHFQALAGDDSDNIPGVRDVGPVAAARLLNECGDLDGIWAALENDGLSWLNKKQRENLEMSQVMMPLWVKLVTLQCDLQLPNPEAFLFRRDTDHRELAAYAQANGLSFFAQPQEDRRWARG